MLTDPRTAPRTRSGRAVFGAAVALVSLVLLAPARTEFGTKVSLFAALTIVCVARVVPMMVNVPPRLSMRTWATSGTGGVAIGMALPVLVGLSTLVIVQRGVPARRAFATVTSVPLPDPRALLPELVPPPGPPITGVDALALQVDPLLSSRAQRSQIADALVLDLAVENEAAQRGDAELLRSVDHGSRLADLTRRASEHRPPEQYALSSARIVVVRPGGQGGLLIGLDASGTTTIGNRTTKVRRVFGLRPYQGDRWLIVDAWDFGRVEVIR